MERAKLTSWGSYWRNAWKRIGGHAKCWRWQWLDAWAGWNWTRYPLAISDQLLYLHTSIKIEITYSKELISTILLHIWPCSAKNKHALRVQRDTRTTWILPSLICLLKRKMSPQILLSSNTTPLTFHANKAKEKTPKNEHGSLSVIEFLAAHVMKIYPTQRLYFCGQITDTRAWVCVWRYTSVKAFCLVYVCVFVCVPGLGI